VQADNYRPRRSMGKEKNRDKKCVADEEIDEATESTQAITFLFTQQ